MFQLAQYEPGAGGLQAAGRRLLSNPQPVIVSVNQVAVELDNIGGYYYLTGGQAPVVTSTESTCKNAMPPSWPVQRCNDLVLS